MADAPLVSVVVIFLNGERFIDQAIQSVFDQTHPHWELILVDDGSTDRSTEISRGYAERFPDRVIYLEHEGHQNRGMSASRNYGIQHARGKYVAFIDADDVWLPYKLAEQVAILERQPNAGLVYGAPRYWYSWSGRGEDVRHDRTLGLGIQANRLYAPPELQLLVYPLAVAPAPCPSDMLVRKETMDRHGWFEESFHGIYQMYEDQPFLAKVYQNTSVYVSSSTWTKYRQHPSSIVSTVKMSGNYHAVRLFFLRWLQTYLSPRVSRDSEVWAALQRALWPYRHPAQAKLASVPGTLKEIATGPRTKWLVKRAVQRTVAPRPRQRLRRLWHVVQGFTPGAPPPVGMVRFGHLRRLDPVSVEFGFDRGLPIDRHYIEQFLDRHAADVRGRVLEIGDASYTRQFGGDRVTHSDVLHVEEGNPAATIVGDLSRGDTLPSATFDCLILTQTLHLIYDLRPAIDTVYRILKPGGVALITFPGISQISRDQWGEHWYWAFTSQSARLLFSETFPAAQVQVEAHGNVLTSISFLHGLAAKELRRAELDYRDPAYELLVTVRVQRPEDSG
jgi:glycosyltransferase involved in cell wall biosynthesis/SAM-dependent methyltransferase